MAEYKLTYFDIDGLAEPIRLLFVLAGVPFEDVRISYTIGQPVVIPLELKQLSPYGQVPFLQFGETILAQSGAIGRFLAKRFGLFGHDDIEGAKIDEIIEAVRDYGESFRVLRLARDEESKANAIKNILQIATPKYASRFNEILSTSLGGYFVGKSPSFADIFVYHFITQFNYQLPGLTKSYPALETLIQKIGAIPEIQKWNQKKNKISTTIVNSNQENS